MRKKNSKYSKPHVIYNLGKPNKGYKKIQFRLKDVAKSLRYCKTVETPVADCTNEGTCIIHAITKHVNYLNFFQFIEFFFSFSRKLKE